MKNTFCIFKEVDTTVTANLIADYTSKANSHYFFNDEGVYRQSDHWGRTARSKWRLIPLDNGKRKQKTGFAKWSDFHKDFDDKALYFIEVDFVKNEVFFNHKNNIQKNNLALLRTSAETTKKIRQIRNLLQNDGWTKYFDEADIKSKIITNLVQTNESLAAIKAKYLY